MSMFRRLALVFVAGAVVLSGCSVFFGPPGDVGAVEESVLSCGAPVESVEVGFHQSPLTHDLTAIVYMREGVSELDVDMVRAVLKAIGSHDGFRYSHLVLYFNKADNSKLWVEESFLPALGLSDSNFTVGTLEVPRRLVESFASGNARK